MYAQFLDTTFDATLLRLGLPLSFSFSFDGVWAHLVVPALFFGPLFASALSRELPLQRHWRWRAHVVDRFCTMQGVRNYALAPLTEEVVFRACVLSVWHMAGISRRAMIWFAPLTFGLGRSFVPISISCVLRASQRTFTMGWRPSTGTGERLPRRSAPCSLPVRPLPC